jgi:hypothetical protein
MTWLGSLPAEVIFPLFAVSVVLLMVALDGILRRRLVPEEVRSSAGPTAATTLQALATIYAVLVAFVIVDESSQLRSAQSQVSNQAGQLAVITENSRNLPDAEGAPIRQATLEYANTVVRVGLNQIEHTARPSVAASRSFQHIFAVVNAIEPTAESDKAAYQQILVALTAIVQSRENLVNSAHASISISLFVILVLLAAAILAVATLMDTQHRRSHLLILGALALGISMTLALVAAFDYPYRGFIRIDETPIRTFISSHVEQ